MGSVLTSKVGGMEDKTRDGGIRRTGKEVVVCIQDMVGNKKFLVQSEDGQRRETSSTSLSYLCFKEEVGQEANETISDPPPEEEGE